MSNTDLPLEVGTIANLIGREKALYLAGCVGGGYITIPKEPTPNHKLVQIIGLDSAQALAEEYFGDIVKIPKCWEIERRFRYRSILEMHSQGWQINEIADVLSVCTRTVFAVLEKGKKHAV